jgi:hypothetical protein
MKVLLDENLPHKLRMYLGEHEGITASYMGWAGLANGRLLSAAEECGMQVLLTGDNNLVYQQSLSGRSIAVVALSELKWQILQRHLPQIVEAIDNATPGSFQLVKCNDTDV